MTDRLLTISLGTKGSLAVITTVKSLTWQAFAEWLTKKPPVVADKAERGWYCPVEFNPVYRDSENFIARHAITFDVDHDGDRGLGLVTHQWAGLAYALYSTYSHTPEKPRFRVVMPLSRPCSYDEFQAVVRKVATDIDIEQFARESYTPSQMMFVPTLKSADSEFLSHIEDGNWLDVDEVLAEYADWTDHKQWPHRIDGDGVHKAEGQTAPDEKVGPVGDFCRAYRVADAIRKFELPYVPTTTEGRWTYTNGSRPEGAIEYDDGLKFHSHHDTDPARGQNNAFDLVRLHKYGSLDDGTASGRPVTERPSYAAMVALAQGLAEVQAARLSDFGDLGPLTDDPTEALQLAADGRAFVFVKAGAISSRPRAVWRIRGLYPQTGIAEVLGNSGDGKSFFIFDTFCSIARGVSWRDRPVKPCGVAYIWAEGRARERVMAYEKKHSVKLDDFPLYILEDAPNLFKAADAKRVIDAILPLGVRVVAVDTLQATSNGANENSSDMSTYLANCNAIAKAIDGLVVISHHLGKDSSKGSRGFSGLKGAADAEITIMRENEQRQAQVTKLKDGRGEGDIHPFTLQELVVDKDDEGQDVTSCVVVHNDKPMEKRGAVRALGKYAQPVYDALKMMAPHGTVSQEDLIAGAAKNMAREGDGRDLRKRSAKRGLDELLQKKRAFMHDEDRVSLTPVKAMSDEEWV